jgi:hypothetical protein
MRPKEIKARQRQPIRQSLRVSLFLAVTAGSVAAPEEHGFAAPEQARNGQRGLKL